MRRALVAGFAVLLLASSAGFATEQAVEAIVPPGEQQIEVIVPPGEQRVEGMASGVGTGGEQQQVDTLTAPTPGEKAASNASKVVTGVTAAAVSLGAMAAMLLFF